MPPPGRDLPSPTADSPLLAWLLTALAPMNRTRVKELLRDGRITVNGTATTRHDYPVRPGDRVTVAREGPKLGDKVLDAAGIRVVYEDVALVVIDKPVGLLSVATEGEKVDTAFAWVSGRLRDRKLGRAFVVHRLDRDTSGLLMFARTEAMRDRLQETWPAVTKTYLAVTEGVPKPPEGVVENYLTEGRDKKVRPSSFEHADAKRAVTRYRVVEEKAGRALVKVGLETGRKHQIRVHLTGLGCPVIGDKVYGATTDPANRLGLHAWKLAFDHPQTGNRVELESPLPAALRRVVS